MRWLLFYYTTYLRLQVTTGYSYFHNYIPDSIMGEKNYPAKPLETHLNFFFT